MKQKEGIFGISKTRCLCGPGFAACDCGTEKDTKYSFPLPPKREYSGHSRSQESSHSDDFFFFSSSTKETQLFHASSFFLIFSLTFLSLSSSALCSSSSTLLSAAEILSNSDYLSMSLTLQLAANSKTLAPHSSSATFFAPTDQAFLRSGQPPLLLLRYYVSSSRFPIETLKTLPRGTRIPTLIPDHSLVVTVSPSSDGYFSINNVRINDDGAVVIYGVDEFVNSPLKISPKAEAESFCSVAKFLRSRGYSVIAAFLEAQLMEIGNDRIKLTIFAPDDRAFQEEYAKNTHIGLYMEIFRRHVWGGRT
ncbi:hypothetical protein TIFTF001_026610 [Ficus carica]|uniref:FAS1 domain-containing protein n=1 Tax=Ficus carica TaxID=3494 RepID=A0AA88DLI8_FICCA|nr:hypothetical protein TIFTF001_026610 [Ficus carica]